MIKDDQIEYFTTIRKNFTLSRMFNTPYELVVSYTKDYDSVRYIVTQDMFKSNNLIYSDKIKIPAKKTVFFGYVYVITIDSISKTMPLTGANISFKGLVLNNLDETGDIGKTKIGSTGYWEIKTHNIVDKSKYSLYVELEDFIKKFKHSNLNFDYRKNNEIDTVTVEAIVKEQLLIDHGMINNICGEGKTIIGGRSGI